MTISTDRYFRTCFPYCAWVLLKINLTPCQFIIHNPNIFIIAHSVTKHRNYKFFAYSLDSNSFKQLQTSSNFHYLSIILKSIPQNHHETIPISIQTLSNNLKPRIPRTMINSDKQATRNIESHKRGKSQRNR